MYHHAELRLQTTNKSADVTTGKGQTSCLHLQHSTKAWLTPVDTETYLQG